MFSRLFDVLARYAPDTGAGTGGGGDGLPEVDASLLVGDEVAASALGEEVTETPTPAAEDKKGEEGDSTTPPDDAAKEPDKDTPPENPIDKKLQAKQQEVANREKAVLAAEERINEATKRLEELAKKFEANPTASNQAKVEEAKDELETELTQAEAMLDKRDDEGKSAFDAYTDAPAVLKALAKATRGALAKNKTLEKQLAEANAKSTKLEQERAAEKQHNDWWNNWADKNKDLGRKAGEDLWKKAVAGVKAAQDKAAEMGLDLSEAEAAKQEFVRLIGEARASSKKEPKEPEAKTTTPPTGGRLGPSTGRVGGATSRPRTLDERVAAGEFDLSSAG